MWLVCIIPKLSRVVVNGSILCTLYTLFDVCVICHVRCGVDGGRNPNHTKKHYSIWRNSGFHQVHFPWNKSVLFDLGFRLFCHIAFDVCVICHVLCGVDGGRNPNHTKRTLVDLMKFWVPFIQIHFAMKYLEVIFWYLLAEVWEVLEPCQISTQ